MKDSPMMAKLIKSVETIISEHTFEIDIVTRRMIARDISKYVVKLMKRGATK